MRWWIVVLAAAACGSPRASSPAQLAPVAIASEPIAAPPIVAGVPAPVASPARVASPASPFADPPWVARNQCTPEPNVQPTACDEAVEPPPATADELVTCGCSLLAAGGITSCKVARSSRGLALSIDAELAHTIAIATRDATMRDGDPDGFLIARNKHLLAAIGGLAAIRTAVLASPPTGDLRAQAAEFPLLAMFLYNWPLADPGALAGVTTALWSAVTQRAHDAIPTANARCQRMLATVRGTPAPPPATRNDLLCAIASSDVSTIGEPLDPQWPWCACGDSPTSRALPFRATAADGSVGTRWACLSTRQAQPDMQFGTAPINPHYPAALSAFATLASKYAAPYALESIVVGDCADARLETGYNVRALKRGDRLERRHLSDHARATACDIESVTFRGPDDKRTVLELREGETTPFLRALKAYVPREFGTSWESFWQIARTRSPTKVFREIQAHLAGEQLGVDRDRDELILGVNVRCSLEEIGFVVYDPLTNTSHDNHFHVELDPLDLGIGHDVGDVIANTMPNGYPAAMRDWLIGEAVDRASGLDRETRAPMTPVAANLHALNRAMKDQPDKISRPTVPAYVTRSGDAGALTFAAGTLTWCPQTADATLALALLDPVRIAWADRAGAAPSGELAIAADGGAAWTWGAVDEHGNARAQPARVGVVHQLTFSVHAAPAHACFAVTVDGGGRYDDTSSLPLALVDHPAELDALRTFVRKLDTAMTFCDPHVVEVVALPLDVTTVWKGATKHRRIASEAELLRACATDDLPRPALGLGLAIAPSFRDATQAAHGPSGHADWHYALRAGHWRLTAARFGDQLTGRP